MPEAASKEIAVGRPFMMPQVINRTCGGRKTLDTVAIVTRFSLS